jgi:ATP-dependent Clp protease ATP-binding subunit ClpB
MQLKIEQSALKKEKDADSKARLKELETEIAVVEADERKLSAEWQAEQKQMRALSDAMTELENIKNEIASATRGGDFERASSLQYGKVPDIERKIADFERGGGADYKTVGAKQIEAVVSKWTGIPAGKLSADDSAKLLDIEKDLQKRVVGQDRAIGAVARSIRRSRAGLSDPNRPTGSFMFLGPTGVGKTELAKALAGLLFSDEAAMTRIDMSEYMEPHSVARLIGAPPGYVGYDRGGILTESVRRRPYQVLLFDEIEKAHPDVFNVFLQILDDGRLTDGQGRVVGFKNVIIIMTSNLKNMEMVKASFRPEFVNRVDEIIFFEPLEKGVMSGIVRIQLRSLEQRLLENSIAMEITDAAVEWLGKNGWDEAYGARPLRRLIMTDVEDKIADLMLSDKIKNHKVRVDAKGKNLVVE